MSVAMSGIVLTLFFDEPFLWPDIKTGLFLMLGVLLGVVGYSAIVSAMRIGEVSVITPFRYSRIVFGLAIGVFLFDESISLSSVLGCILVVMSSLVVLSQHVRNLSGFKNFFVNSKNLEQSINDRFF